ncbi:MAG: cation:dicarboxylase symporter family transporter, partial [Oscillospiraceae bacterium]|nr:cation:dicarboxylase symporter family transporter [Candidatus Equicaccousia limihippi]
MKTSGTDNKQTYLLSPETVDEISKRIVEYCAEKKIDSKSTAKYRLAAEESLSVWLDKFGNNTEVELEFGRRLFRGFIRLKIKGERINPYDNRETAENYGTAANDILIRVGLIPEFNYRFGTNSLTFNLKKPPKNQIFVLLGIIILSLLVGFGGQAVLGDGITASISQNLITPVEDTFFGILSAIAGPMIFLSVAWGVYGIGDVYTLGKIGKKLMLAFVSTIFVFVFIGTLFYPLLGPSLSKTSAGASQFSNIFKMFLSVFPSNIFSPFIEGNTLQIIFLAFIIGLSMIFLGQRTTSVARAVEQINHIITFLMEFVSKLVPYFVFIVLVNIIWTGTLGAFEHVIKFTAVFLIASVICN